MLNWSRKYIKKNLNHLKTHLKTRAAVNDLFDKIIIDQNGKLVYQ